GKHSACRSTPDFGLSTDRSSRALQPQNDGGLLYTELTKPMEPKEPILVLVVGAGPTGLVTALTLAVNGVRARVIDSHPSALTSSRALGCQPRSMEILAALGVAEPILAVSEPLHGSSIMRGTEELVDVRWIPPEAPFPYTYVFPES